MQFFFLFLCGLEKKYLGQLCTFVCPQFSTIIEHIWMHVWVQLEYNREDLKLKKNHYMMYFFTLTSKIIWLLDCHRNEKTPHKIWNVIFIWYIKQTSDAKRYLINLSTTFVAIFLIIIINVNTKEYTVPSDTWLLYPKFVLGIWNPFLSYLLFNNNRPDQ